MPKIKKIKKNIGTHTSDTKDEVKKTEGEDEVEKESGTLSDGVLDAFDEVTPVDPLLLEEDEVVLPENEEDDDEIDSGDYKPLDDW